MKRLNRILKELNSFCRCEVTKKMRIDMTVKQKSMNGWRKKISHEDLAKRSIE